MQYHHLAFMLIIHIVSDGYILRFIKGQNNAAEDKI